MTISHHKQHKIYIAAVMGLGLGSEDPEEFEYYNKIREEMKKDVKNGYKGIKRTD